MKTEIKFKLKASGGGEATFTPSVGIFIIDDEMAKQIITLAGMVKEKSLRLVERWDARVQYLAYDPETEQEDATEAGDDNYIRAEDPRMVVTADAFWFRAYIKHTSDEISTENVPVESLREYFKI